jgi:hypothetical protein
MDALKIDVEGMEIPFLGSLSILVLARISCIMAECETHAIGSSVSGDSMARP